MPDGRVLPGVDKSSLEILSDVPRFLASEEHRLFLLSLVEVIDNCVGGKFVQVGVHDAQLTRCILCVMGKLGCDTVLNSIDHILSGYRVLNGWKRAHRRFGNSDFVMRPSNKFSLWHFKSVAWISIHGCHCLECSLENIDSWGAKIVPGGIMVCHDTSIEGNRQRIDFCLDLWHLLPDRRKTIDSKDSVKRPWGVAEALHVSKVIRNSFEMIHCDDDHGPGIRIYRRKGSL